jgi:hypothetical protein
MDAPAKGVFYHPIVSSGQVIAVWFDRRGFMGSSHVMWDNTGAVHDATADCMRRAQVLATLDYPALVA